MTKQHLLNCGTDDVILMKYMQKFPVRDNIRRAREGNVDNYPDTRKNPIKRMQLERAVEFLKENQNVYAEFINVEFMDALAKIRDRTKTAERPS